MQNRKTQKLSRRRQLYTVYLYFIENVLAGSANNLHTFVLYKAGSDHVSFRSQKDKDNVFIHLRMQWGSQCHKIKDSSFGTTVWSSFAIQKAGLPLCMLCDFNSMFLFLYSHTYVRPILLLNISKKKISCRKMLFSLYLF